EGCIAATVDRSPLWLAATPQMFRYGLLCRALEAARSQGVVVTDEAEAVENWLSGQGTAAPGGINLVPGSAANLKVTYPEDLRLAALLLGAGSGMGLPVKDPLEAGSPGESTCP
ncbi:MAG TPA: 2-C-methyl-D-erythritol 4-phosphate cytidylyltransferase, partial [Hyphomicrobiales bacterium]|nr:2-C-methyl-D-erythritol 4-phosphate cytidylyltransferase [Hyphomicrobiales bacterium]